MTRVRPFDKILFLTVAALVVGGFLIFMSASLGLLARDGAQFSDVALGQFLLGVVGGAAALFVASLIPYRLYRTYAIYLFGIAVIVTFLVFVPHIGLYLNGAHRWIDLRVTTFQPAEILKITYVLFLAAWLARKEGKRTMLERLIPFGAITGIVAIILLAQPDTGTFLTIAAAGGAMFVASGAKVKDLAVIVLLGAMALGSLVAVRPYLLERIETFFDPASDPLGSSYQVQQSLLAVGSGQLFGRGFGQSVQKFNYLPEPIGDSIFAVYAEEFGFVGGIILIGAFLLFGLRGLWIAARAPDQYGGLVAVGIVILVMAQSYLNIGSMLGVFPLTGLPLIFISHGGTALFMSLASVGILLNISRARRVG